MRIALVALFAASSLAGCKHNPDNADKVDAGDDRLCSVSQANVCLQAEAENHSDFAWLKQNMFATNCSTDDCHGATTNGQPPGGGFFLTDDEAYMSLLGKAEADTGPAPLVASFQDPNHKLVTPGNPEASYLLFILKGIRADEGTPAFAEPDPSVGYMPQSNSTLCCQKLDVVRRWIEAGAAP